MLKNSTIIIIEINGFNRRTQAENPAATVQYLAEYYELISGLVSRQGWRFVKSMGDCVLVAAHENSGTEDIVSLYEAISNRFDVSFRYRECEFEEVEFSFVQYSCLDAIGKDINNLFLNDSSTMVLG
jgi:class 3 adenylate cyclase